MRSYRSPQDGAGGTIKQQRRDEGKESTGRDDARRQARAYGVSEAKLRREAREDAEERAWCECTWQWCARHGSGCQ